MQPLSDEERLAFTHAVMSILNHWQVSSTDQIKILDLPKEIKPRTLKRYRETTPLPDSSAVMERAEHLLGIAEALRTSFPHNISMGTIWMNTPHRRFDNRTPLTTIIEDGYNGIVAVRSHVDCAFSWYLTEPKP
jgi:uncharacterized protein (DUF2384 family)